MVVEQQMTQQLSWRWNVGALWPEAGDEEEHSQGPPAMHLQEQELEGEALMHLSATHFSNTKGFEMKFNEPHCPS